MKHSVTARDASAPGFLRLAGHPVRWRLLAELAFSDRQVGELSALLGQAQSLVSYHLAQLRAGELVSMRRSSADRRDSYYSLDLTRCGQLLAEAGGALHPGLRLVPPPVAMPTAPPGDPHVPGGRPRARLLFLCTGNSARSPMAETLAGQMSGGGVEARSAGSHPKPLHPNTVRVLRDRYGIDITGRRPTHLDAVAGQRFDYVISLCDRVREVCLDMPGTPRGAIHWSIPDPAAGGGTHADTYPAFTQMADELEARIGFLVHRVSQTTPTTPPARR